MVVATVMAIPLLGPLLDYQDHLAKRKRVMAIPLLDPLLDYQDHLAKRKRVMAMPLLDPLLDTHTVGPPSMHIYGRPKIWAVMRVRQNCRSEACGSLVCIIVGDKIRILGRAKMRSAKKRSEAPAVITVSSFCLCRNSLDNPLKL